MLEACTQFMDCTLSSSNAINSVDIRRLHLSSWRFIGHSIRSRGTNHWGIRQKPKMICLRNLNFQTVENQLMMVNWLNRVKQLLQFSKSYRPTFCGIWSIESHVVGPRYPFRKDPDLDYDVDSDEEWEKEDPGERLSDCDKDDEENLEEEGCAKAKDDEDNEGEFFVPDGYLSENEGVKHDRMETDHVDEVKSTPSSKQDMEGKELCSLFK
ncbi:Chromatin assembly factor 1 subunit FAS1, partial [Cucurbita argyrosperma subsp. sororia]